MEAQLRRQKGPVTDILVWVQCFAIDHIPRGTGLETNHVLPLRASTMTLSALRRIFGIIHFLAPVFSRERSSECSLRVFQEESR